jgi:hypothetical protein
MNNQMAQMRQETDSEFSGDDNEERNIVGPEMYNDDTSDDKMSASTKLQSLSADFNQLSTEAHLSSLSPQSALFYC